MDALPRKGRSPSKLARSRAWPRATHAWFGAPQPRLRAGPGHASRGFRAPPCEGSVEGLGAPRRTCLALVTGLPRNPHQRTLPGRACLPPAHPARLSHEPPSGALGGAGTRQVGRAYRARGGKATEPPPNPLLRAEALQKFSARSWSCGSPPMSTTTSATSLGGPGGDPGGGTMTFRFFGMAR